MQCILTTEAVTVSNVIAIASLVSEIWLASERHTHTHAVSVSSVKLCKANDFTAQELNTSLSTAFTFGSKSLQRAISDHPFLKSVLHEGGGFFIGARQLALKHNVRTYNTGDVRTYNTGDCRAENTKYYREGWLIDWWIDCFSPANRNDYLRTDWKTKHTYSTHNILN